VCAGELRLSTHKPKTSKTIVLASARFSVVPGKSTIVHLRLSGAGRAIVRSGGTRGLASMLTALPQGVHAPLTSAARSVRLVAALPPRPSRVRPKSKHH
jgi:hypothetical protein